MLSEEIIKQHTLKNRAYNLDMADKALDELIDEFLSEGNGETALYWSSMRMYLYQCGTKLGVQEQNRAIKINQVEEKLIEQQTRAFKLMPRGYTK